LSKSTGPGRSKARAQPRVGASARVRAAPEAQSGPQPELEVLRQKPRDGREVRRPGTREKVYKQERSGRGSGKAAHPASKNKHPASSHTLSYSLIPTLLPHFFSLPP